MKSIIKIHICLSMMILMFSSCEKDNITTSVDELVSNEIKMERDLKNNLANAPNGWVMMVKSTLAEKAYVPVVMKFDTARNMVRMKSIYGTTKQDSSTFLINKGVSGILLNFSGGSVVSSLMRMDRVYSNVTDYVFKVLAITPESIKIQGMKSGEAHKPEGGVIYTLFKRPDNWKWADNNLLLDMKTNEARANVSGRYGVMTMNYVQDSEVVNLGYYFSPNFDSNLPAWQGVDPFYNNASANVYDKYYLYTTAVNYTNTGTIQNSSQESPAARQGHNALCYTPFSGNATTSDVNAKYVKTIKTTYLVINEVIRSGTDVTMKLAAYDKEGKDYIVAEYRNYNK